MTTATGTAPPTRALAPRTDSWLMRPGKGDFPHVTREEVGRLIAAAPTEQTRLLLRVLWETGARVSEVLALRVADVDTAAATLTIRRLKRRRPFEQVLPIGEDLAGAIRLFARAKGRRGRIFTASRVSAWRTVKALGRRVLGRAVYPHQFRHGRAYELVARGTHPLLVSRILGHAALGSALAYYHPTEEDLRAAMQGAR